MKCTKMETVDVILNAYMMNLHHVCDGCIIASHSERLTIEQVGQILLETEISKIEPIDTGIEGVHGYHFMFPDFV